MINRKIVALRVEAEVNLESTLYMRLYHVLQTHYPDQLQFFCDSYEEGPSPLQILIDMMSNISDGIWVSQSLYQAFEVFAEDVVLACAKQHQDDPSCYISHDFRHSLMVHAHMVHLFEQTHVVIQAAEAMTKLSYPLITFTFDMIHLLHDIGYPKQSELGVQKSNHTFEGAYIFKTQIAPKLQGLFRQLHIPIKQQSKMIRMITEGILYHGADKIEDHYNIKCQTSLGTFYTQEDKWPKFKQFCLDRQLDVTHVSTLSKPVPIRYLDCEKKNDNAFGIACMKLDLVEDPFTGVIRYTDNAHTCHGRLSDEQKTSDIVRQYQANPLSDQCLLRPPEGQDRYLAGIVPVESTQVIGSQESLGLQIHMNQHYHPLMAVKVQFDDKMIKLPLFYVKRIQDAFKWLTFNQIPIRVDVCPPYKNIAKLV